ncbi:hypothetical protein FOVG_01428 [Fusarium oxysporum f. sp. pisi HDV247]|uniref:Uncharacterized protein n=1 Tax=Fusarium oxysporum f. sp. pisi HDV247 TaxID=1080344 RepID=W9Q825_FUSOX|nr:hypothetical protein FOVG_01428 [Fusarium oxysporum f. sp. pisi HDV247]
MCIRATSKQAELASSTSSTEESQTLPASCHINHFWNMCRKYVRKGICGHQLGVATWVPEDVEDCRQARRQQRSSGGRLRRCSPPQSTSITTVHDTACNRPECYIEYVLLRIGWVCHNCGGQNGPGYEYCEVMLADPYHPHDPDLYSRCGHGVCRNCTPPPRRGRR